MTAMSSEWTRLKSSVRQQGRHAMRASLQVVLVGVTVTFLSVTPIAAAEPKDEVEAAAAAWGQALDHHSSAMPSPPK
jgi:hypothetical protein